MRRYLEYAPVTHVVVVHIQESRRVCPSLVTLLGIQAQGAEAGHIVGDVQKRNVWHVKRLSKEADLVVEVVVYEVHTILRVVCGEIGRPLDVAGERTVCGVEGRFPQL